MTIENHDQNVRYEIHTINNDPNIFKQIKCGVCRKRVATKLCDFVVEYHTPVFYRSYEDFSEQELHKTCNFPMCEKCSKQHNRIYDFCPHHVALLEQIKPTKEMQKSITEYQVDHLDLFGVQEVQND